jgi:hypothetical protein
MRLVVTPDMIVGIPAPPPDSAPLWRYLTLEKFRSLVDGRALFFPHVAILDDQFEGAFPESQPLKMRALNMIGVRDLTSVAQVNLSPQLSRAWILARKWALVSCWHQSAYESDAMWRLYAADKRAVAIQTTVGCLRQALGTPPPVPDGFFGSTAYEFGNVEYIDYSDGFIPPANLNAQFFRKRVEFRHEQEVRVLIARYPLGPDRTIRSDIEPSDKGMACPVALGALLKRVVVAPGADEEYLDAVARSLAEVVPAVSVERSSLDATPNY